MNISGQGTTRLLESVLDAQSTRAEMNVAVLDKANEIVKEQGQAMIQMLEQSVVSPDQNRLDAYA